MSNRLLILILAVVLNGTLLVQTATGKEFPEKPIEIICPYTPGGSMDIMSRLVADIAPKYLGQPLLVVNKPGAAGSIAAADVISSKPDGYKLITLTSFFLAATVKTQKVPFNPDDLVPIANLMEFKFGMIVKGDSPWKTLGDLLDYARKNPGQLRWGHPGRGISIHMSGLLIFRKAGVETVDIPYKGAPEVLASLLGGHIDAAASVYGAVRDHAKSGKVRYLTVFSDRRYGDASDVPCVVELGFPEAAVPSFVGLYARKNTPEDIKKTLMDALKKTFEEPEFKKGIEKLGEEPRYGGPEFMKEAIKKGGEVGLPILKELGLYVGK
jgi:tripartite-type tricarboxylate transporter receptor subunit TctC